MKISCLLKGFIYFIVLIGIVSYLWNKYDDDVISYSKKKFNTYLDEQIKSKLDNFNNAEIKDSLNVYFEQFKGKFNDKSLKDIYGRATVIKEKLDDYLQDNVISKIELKSLKETILNE